MMKDTNKTCGDCLHWLASVNLDLCIVLRNYPTILYCDAKEIMVYSDDKACELFSGCLSNSKDCISLN